MCTVHCTVPLNCLFIFKFYAKWDAILKKNNIKIKQLFNLAWRVAEQLLFR